jgi:predicted DNA-binding protein with PD1-like motif
MRSKPLDPAPHRSFVLVYETGDDILPPLQAFAEQHGLAAAHFTAIGALERVTLGYFDWQTKDYLAIPLDEQVEVVSLIGDIARADGKPKVHAHIVVARRDGTAHGGHLLGGRVRPTLELILEESPAWLARRHDPQSGLALIDPSV